jgi:hypothetical protein
MTASKRTVRLLSLSGLLVGVVVACSWASFRVCEDAYGAGPPYYGLTTNMDKWEAPTAHLLRLNAGGLLLVALLSAAIYRARRDAR